MKNRIARMICSEPSDSQSRKVNNSATVSPLSEFVFMPSQPTSTIPARTNQNTSGDSSGGSAIISTERSSANLPKWVALVVGAAVVLRLASAFGDLAIDEIWSWYFVHQAARNLFEIFAIRHDNNHLLNSLMIRLLGPSAPDILYRLPAAASSILSVVLAGRIAMRRGGWLSCLFTSILTGASYLMVLYGSEARGYSYAVLFTYLSWLFLMRIDERRHWRDAAGFALSACLGFLGHLTFLYCFAGLCVWTLWKWVKRPSWLLPLAFIPPTALAALLYLFFIRGMAIGGGPETTVMSALISTLSLVAGGPLYDDGALICALLTLILLATGLLHVWRTDRALACSYFTTIVAAPALVLVLTGHQLIYPRYFLVPIAVSLLVFGDLFAYWWRTTRVPGHISVVTLLALFLMGNPMWTRDLFDHGRGDYSQAMRWMASHSSDLPASVSSDHDFRNGLMFAYYSNRIWPSPPPLQYRDQRSLQGAATDWVIRHNFEGDPPFPSRLSDPSGHSYELERVFAHHSLTGWNWWIYRRVDEKLKRPQMN